MDDFPELGPDEAVPSDPINVLGGRISGRHAFLDVEYERGCGRQDFSMCFRPARGDAASDWELALTFQTHEPDDCGQQPVQVTLGFNLEPLIAAAGTDIKWARTQYGPVATGPLACEDRVTAAGLALQAARESLDLSCSSEEDCKWVNNDTNCHYACGEIVSAASEKQFQDAIEAINQGFCAEFELQCEEPLVPPCEAPPQVRCIDGLCQESPGDVP